MNTFMDLTVKPNEMEAVAISKRSNEVKDLIENHQKSTGSIEKGQIT